MFVFRIISRLKGQFSQTKRQDPIGLAVATDPELACTQIDIGNAKTQKKFGKF